MFGEVAWISGLILCRCSSHRRRHPSRKSVFISASESRSPLARRTHKESRSDEIWSLRQDQVQHREDTTTMREMIQELSVAVARAEKRPVMTVPEPDYSLEARLRPPPLPLPPPVFLAAMGGGGVS